MRVLITGAAGFLGHKLCELYCENHEVWAQIRPGSRAKRLRALANDLTIWPWDITVQAMDSLPKLDLVIHSAAMATSLEGELRPRASIENNVIGTLNCLELAERQGAEQFIYLSTAEVFGPQPLGKSSREWDSYDPRSVYAAGKISAGELVSAWQHRHTMKTATAYVNNTYGERCQRERFPVRVIDQIMKDQQVKLHSDDQGQVGGRRWLYAGELARQIQFAYEHQTQSHERWCCAGTEWISNLEFAKHVAGTLGKRLDYELVKVDRQGHDVNYSVDPQRLVELGWRETETWRSHLEQTVAWYVTNPDWL